jgi:hypothetical protein
VIVAGARSHAGFGAIGVPRAAWMSQRFYERLGQEWPQTDAKDVSLKTCAARAYTRRMPKTEPPPMYACMMPKSDLRRVQQPHDERVVITRRPLRRMLAKLTGAVRL